MSFVCGGILREFHDNRNRAKYLILVTKLPYLTSTNCLQYSATGPGGESYNPTLFVEPLRGQLLEIGISPLYKMPTDVGAQVAMVQIGFPLRPVAKILAGQIMEPPDAGDREALKNRVFAGRHRSAEIFHGQGQTGAQPRNIAPLEIDMKMGRIAQRPGTA